MRIKASSREMMPKKTHERKCETNNDKQSLKAQSLTGYLPDSKLAH